MHPSEDTLENRKIMFASFSEAYGKFYALEKLDITVKKNPIPTRKNQQ